LAQHLLIAAVVSAWEFFNVPVQTEF